MAARPGFRTASGQPPAAALAALARRVAIETPKALTAAALLLERQAKDELSTPGRGRRYGHFSVAKNGEHARTKKGTIRRRYHIASAPGDPPAVDTGLLRASITHEVDGTVVRVGTNVKYAPWLEFGTKGPEYTGGRIAPRPFFRPALEKVRRVMGERIIAALQRAASTAGGAS